MKQNLAGFVRVSILAAAAVALIGGVSEARMASTASRSCYFIPPYYVGACADTPDCQNMCDPYWPGQRVGACLGEPLCCVCE